MATAANLTKTLNTRKRLAWFGMTELGDLSIGEVAAIVGVRPHTLRAWERRYGVVRPRRSARNQRRYTVEDVETLSRLREATGGGSVSIRRIAVGPAEDHGTQVGDLSVWRAAVDLVPAVVLLVDGRGRILDANAAAASTVGVARGELRGRRLRDVVDAGADRRAAAVYRAPIAQRRDVELGLRSARAPVPMRFDCWPAGPLLVLVGH